MAKKKIALDEKTKAPKKVKEPALDKVDETPVVDEVLETPATDEVETLEEVKVETPVEEEPHDDEEPVVEVEQTQSITEVNSLEPIDPLEGLYMVPSNPVINNHIAKILSEINCFSGDSDEQYKLRMRLFTNIINLLTVGNQAQVNEFFNNFLLHIHENRHGNFKPAYTASGYEYRISIKYKHEPFYSLFWAIMNTLANPAGREKRIASLQWGTIVMMNDLHKSEIISQKLLKCFGVKGVNQK